MRLTDEQRIAIQRDEQNTLLAACPGSGKTRTIIAKLLRCIEEVRGTSRRVACITYTNAGVHEIEHRLRLYGRSDDDEYCDVSTIHAFCLNQILRYIYWRIPDYCNGFTVLPPEEEGYRTIAREACAAEGIEFTAQVGDAFEYLNREPDGSPILGRQPLLTPQVAMQFWRLLAERGYIDFPNIVYWSLWLLRQRPTFARAIASRYAWMLIDEFQDTSALQVDILRLMARQNRTRFLLVGDPMQSILSFAGARPDLMDTFGAEINATPPLSLSGNWRCSQRIVEHAERLCPRDSPMQAIGENTDCGIEPQHVHANTVFEAITDYFIPALAEHQIPFGQTAILAPWWIALLHLGRSLRQYGVPIVGPGARPYQRDRLYGQLAEHLCAYLEHRDAKLISRIERVLFDLLLNATRRPRFDLYSYQGRITVYRILAVAKQLREECEGGVDWLRRSATAISELLVEEGWLSANLVDLLPSSVDDMYQDMADPRRQVDLANLTTADLGLFAIPERSMKLLTMHGAKGREFAAVAVVDLHEGRVPHFSAQHFPEVVEEGRRQLYVAITRAEQLLMYVTDSSDQRNRPSRFLGLDGLSLLGD